MTRYLEIKPGSIAEVAKKLREDYDAYFKKELEKTGKTIPQMTDAEKKAFFNRVDKGYNAKDEATEPGKPEDSKTTLVAAPGNKEKVIRIPKEKLADYKKKGYVEAESYIPEAKKIDELTAGQKKLPPALQKAIKAKEKNEDIASMNPNNSPQARDYTAREKDIKPKKNEPLSQVDLFLKKMKDPKFAAAFRLSQKKENTNEEAAKNPYAIGMAAAMKSTGDTPPLKKSTITKAHDIAKKIEKNEELTAAQKKLPPALQKAIDKKEKNEEASLEEADDKRKDDPCWKDYKMVGMKKKNGKDVPNCVPKEEVEIDEAGMKAIATDQAELKRLRVRLQQLRDTENASAGGDTTDIERQIHQTRLSILDLQKKELEKEDVDADVINKKQKDVKGEKEVVNEAKKNYKSYKKSLKKEEEDPKKIKTTLTGKPLTKIDVEPKLDGHN